MKFKYHMFFCTNQRNDGAKCCEDAQASQMRDYAKQRVKDLGLNAAGGVRINNAGCLGLCEKGPVAVIYPEGVWYSYSDQSDIDEIIHEHLSQGRPVERLMID
jgi:(2Fe-2S) ferredoxin